MAHGGERVGDALARALRGTRIVVDKRDANRTDVAPDGR